MQMLKIVARTCADPHNLRQQAADHLVCWQMCTDPSPGFGNYKPSKQSRLASQCVGTGGSDHSPDDGPARSPSTTNRTADARQPHH